MEDIRPPMKNDTHSTPSSPTLYWVGDNLGSGAPAFIEALCADGTVYLSLPEAASVISQFDPEGRQRILTALNLSDQRERSAGSGSSMAPLPA